MRRKFVLVILVLVTVLSGCTNRNPYAPSPSPTPLPAGQSRIVTALPATNTSPDDDDDNNTSENVSPEYLIGADHGLEVYFVDAYIGEDNKEYYEIMFHNNSENTMRADSISIAINGISVFAYVSEYIESGEYYIYKDYISTNQSSFMQNYEHPVQVQAEIYGISPLDNSVVAHVNQTLILDESIQLIEPDFKGKIIHDRDDYIIGIDKIVDGDNITSFVIYYENNSDNAVGLYITHMEVGSHIIPDKPFYAITEGTYAYWIIELNDPIPNEVYDVTINYDVIDDIYKESEVLKHETSTFTLD